MYRAKGTTSNINHFARALFFFLWRDKIGKSDKRLHFWNLQTHARRFAPVIIRVCWIMTYVLFERRQG